MNSQIHQTIVKWSRVPRRLDPYIPAHRSPHIECSSIDVIVAVKITAFTHRLDGFLVLTPDIVIVSKQSQAAGSTSACTIHAVSHVLHCPVDCLPLTAPSQSCAGLPAACVQAEPTPVRGHHLTGAQQRRACTACVTYIRAAQ